MSQPIRGRGGDLVFPISQKNKNKNKLGRGCSLMLKCCFLSSFVEFGSAVSEERTKTSQPIRGQGTILFSHRPEKHQLYRERCDLASSQVFFFNSVHRFQRRSRTCLSKLEARTAILFFSDRPGKHKLGRGG